jgi:hypothetical protein
MVRPGASRVDSPTVDCSTQVTNWPIQILTISRTLVLTRGMSKGDSELA